MSKKTLLIILFFAINAGLSIGQSPQSVLSAPENWKSELFIFPIGFAPSIDLTGFEDLRFSPGWSDTSSQNFWTYTFVWYIDKGFPMTESSLSKNMETYFDGLMKIDPVDSNGPEKTRSIFIKTKKGFQGKIWVHDAFFTKKPMTLYVKVKETYCAKTNKQVILFELSSKEFDHPTWEIFKEVKLLAPCK